MYYAVVGCFMFAFPLLSVAVEVSTATTYATTALLGKWFVFWSVGWRLFLAGMRQIVQPEYTAREILGLKSTESNLLVRELGFGNFALGVVGILSIWLPSWRLAVALAGGLFYGLAGINHFLQAHRNRLQNAAMASDLFVSVVLLGVCLAAAVGK